MAGCAAALLFVAAFGVLVGAAVPPLAELDELTGVAAGAGGAVGVGVLTWVAGAGVATGVAGAATGVGALTGAAGVAGVAGVAELEVDGEFVGFEGLAVLVGMFYAYFWTT